MTFSTKLCVASFYTFGPLISKFISKTKQIFKQRSTCRTITGRSLRRMVWVFSSDISNTVMIYHISVITYINVIFVNVLQLRLLFSFIGLLIIKNGPSLQMNTRIRMFSKSLKITIFPQFTNILEDIFSHSARK